MEDLSALLAIRAYVRLLLESEAAGMAAMDRRVEELEAAGYQIISGGQTGPDTWDVTDWRTGEEIASGDGGIAAHDEAIDRLDTGERWFHYDCAMRDMDYSYPPPPDGVSESLAVALQGWLDTHTPKADVENVAAVAGWPVEKVTGYLT